MRRFMPRALAAAAGVAALALAAHAGSSAADWPQFRGIHRDGISAETGLLKSWPASGPRQVWRRPIGQGFSSISISGGKLFTMDAGDHEGKPTEFAVALDPATGKDLWRTPVGKKYDNEFGNGPRATPTVQGDTVYVLGSVGTVMALSAKDGAPIWKVEATEAFGTKVPYFGYSGSLLVDNGTVFVEGGGPNGKAFSGLDAKTGSVLWTYGEGANEAGYNSPLDVTLNGKRQYVHIMGDKVFAVDGSGKEVWKNPWPDMETHAMPIFVAPDLIFGSGVEGVGAALLQIGNGPDGATVKEVWKNPTFRTHFNAAVLNDGHLFGFDNATFKCISVKDGSLAWTKRGLGKGSLILADDRLVVLSDDGKLLLVEANAGAYTEKGSVQALTGRCWTPPALAGGRVYVRNHTEIVAYDVKG